MFGAAVVNGSCNPFCDHSGAVFTYVTHIKPFNLQTLPTGLISHPGKALGVSRGNKLTNGQRWDGKGTKVKVHEAGVAGNRLCVSSLTAFNNGTLVI